MRASINWYAWHLADAVPFLDIPDAFGWSLQYTFTDRWSGAALLATKFFFFTLLIMPFTWQFRLQEERGHATSQLDAPRVLADSLARIHAALDEAQARVVPEGRANRSVSTQGREIRLLGPSIARVQALFGDGEVSNAAVWAVEDIAAWNEALEGTWPSLTSSSRHALEQARNAATGRLKDFENLFEAALREESMRSPRNKPASDGPTEPH